MTCKRYFRVWIRTRQCKRFSYSNFSSETHELPVPYV